YTNDFGFSYLETDSKSQRISDLVIGNILIKDGEENNYCRIKYPDGRIAFIEKEYCVELNGWINNSHPTEENIISTAKSFMGIPYLWGGTSAKGMDCSGFTKTVYYLNGVVMSRDASQQVNTGILVDTNNGFDNLQPGDLLFFGSRKTEKRNERITHVGIYIGDYEYIHAAGEVKINSLNVNAKNFNLYRLNHFIRAKRIINSVDKNGVTSIKNNKFYSGDFE
ncbi:MAG: C40 family peptidase, partial [Melioribacteraceae bacterium]|nr:C40 family peptidase [Melioribacteraceae bacterium]